MRPGVINLRKAGDPVTAGPKAAALSRLMQAGFEVPPGFVIPNRSFSSRKPYVRVPLKKEILENYNELNYPGNTFVAVRSSAANEDLPGFSLAGQYETVLNVGDDAGLLKAVERVRISVSRPAYRLKHRADSLNKISVLVQTMVKARAAGVAFTCEPVSGNNDKTLINAVQGLGDQLVAGRVTPDEYLIDRKSGKTEIHPAGKKPVLTPDQIKELCTLARKAEALFGCPQDIEWAHDGQRFWVLQSRPVTALDRRELPEIEWGDPENQVLARDHLIFWSNWNTRENMAYPLKPMAWSFFNDILVPVITRVLYGVKPGSALSHHSHFVDLVNGRAYWNMSMLAGHPFAGRMIMPLLDRLDSDAAQSFRILARRGEFKPIPARLPWYKLIWPVAVGTVNFISFPWLAPAGWIDRRCRRFLTEVRDYLELPLERMSVTAMLGQARRYGYFIARFAFPLLVISSKALWGIWIIERLIRRWPEIKPRDLMSGIQGNKTTETALELFRLSKASGLVKAVFTKADIANITDVKKLRGKLEKSAAGADYLKKIDGFLEEYGHRGLKDLDAGHPSWKEDPSYIFGLLKSYMALKPGDHDPLEQFHKAVDKRLALEKKIRSRLSSFDRMLFDFALRLVRDYLPWRENEKFYGSKVFPGSRRIIAEIGRRYREKGLLLCSEDIYYLTVPEVEKIESGAGPDVSGLRKMVAERKARWLKQVEQPAEFIVRSDGRKVFDLTSGRKEGKIIRGVAASAGRAEGRARVITDPSRSGEFRKGEILVAPFTEPGWAPLFLLSRGLVMEVGGAICHGAIAARECGIPAVVGAKGAMAAIRTGDWIVVDGDAGTVIKVDQNNINHKTHTISQK
jgi:pyruvate,water dikinase